MYTLKEKIDLIERLYSKGPIMLNHDTACINNVIPDGHSIGLVDKVLLTYYNTYRKACSFTVNGNALSHIGLQALGDLRRVCDTIDTKHITIYNDLPVGLGRVMSLSTVLYNVLKDDKGYSRRCYTLGFTDIYSKNHKIQHFASLAQFRWLPMRFLPLFGYRRERLESGWDVAEEVGMGGISLSMAILIIGEMYNSI